MAYPVSVMTNREYEVLGSWYSPCYFFMDNFRSVVKSAHYDTTSSWGDWVGYLVQKIGRKFYYILFFQSFINGISWATKTDNLPFVVSDCLMKDEEICDIINERLNELI